MIQKSIPYAPILILILALAAMGCPGSGPVPTLDSSAGGDGVASDGNGGGGGDGQVSPADKTVPPADKGAPVNCQITHPPRAAMLTGPPAVTIRGKVMGSLSNLASVQVNGQKVSPSPGGEFSLPVTSKWGVNIIVVDCADKGSKTVHRVQAYHWSSKYRPNAGGVTAMKVTRGALARLYQKALDDGHRASLNDLASILVKVINGLNFDKLIPSTLVSGKYKVPPFGPTISYSVSKNGTFKVNPFTISLKARSGGLRVTGKTSYLELPVKAKAGVSVSGKVKISNLSLVGDINISKKSGGAVQVSVPKLDMNYSSLKVEIGSGIIGSITSSITSGIASLFKNSILNKMESEVKKALPGPVKSFVTGFTLDQSFKLPAELGGKALSIHAELDTILFDSNGGNLELATAVHGAKGIASGKLGTVSTSASCSPPGTSSAAMLVALHHDTLNQMLNATWYTGALQRDVSSLVSGVLKPGALPLPFTVTKLSLHVDALLPPIIKQGTANNNFEFQVGDVKLKVDATVKDSAGTPSTIKADVYVSAKTPGTITFNSNNRLSLSVSTKLSAYQAEIQNLVVQGSNPLLGQLFTVLVRDMVKTLLPTMGPNIVQSFPLPAIDLSALGGSYGIPKGTKLKIKSGKLIQQGGYLVFSGELG